MKLHLNLSRAAISPTLASSSFVGTSWIGDKQIGQSSLACKLSSAEGTLDSRSSRDGKRG